MGVKSSCFTKLAIALALAVAPQFAVRAVAQYPTAAPTAPPSAPSPGISLARPRFSADAIVQPGESGTPEVRIDYRLARSELLFERGPSGYRAAYEIRAIFTKGKQEIAGDAATRDLRVERYSETQTQGNDIIDHITFRIPSGKYEATVFLTDLNAECTSSTTIPIEVPSVEVGKLWLTDLVFGTLGGDTTEAGTDASTPLVPNPSRSFGDDLPHLAVAGEVVDNRPTSAPDSLYKMSYRVLNEVQAVVAHGDTTLPRRGPRTPFRILPSLGPLEPGVYRFLAELTSPLIQIKGQKKPAPIRREKDFTVEASSANAAVDPKSSLEVLRYIATEAEITEMDRLKTPEERKVFWEAFWRHRDPSPETARNEAMDEFYKRVRYADQRFGVGGPGWKTDMGRIYIQYGQPDEIARNPFRFDGPPEEIWYYYQQRKTFVFVDRDGFGRYELDLERTP